MLLVDEQEKAPQEDKEEELTKQRLIAKKLRKRYKAAKLEIDDLTKEFATFKQEHLAHIRLLEKDLKFNKKLVETILNENELYKLRQKANWDEDFQDWTVPLFIFNSKEHNIAFPDINAKMRVEQSKEERELVFTDSI